MSQDTTSDVKFSVLIPVYIKENPLFLETALRSIIDQQSVRPNEIIVVEDGPITPELDSVLTFFEKREMNLFKRLKLKENQGMGKAMNYGLERVSCPWVARMDSDDIAKPDRFKIQTTFIKNNPSIHVLGSSIEEFNHVPGDLKHLRVLPTGHQAIIQMMKRRNPINHMTTMYRSDVALKAGGYWSERYFEDYNLWYEMKKCGAIFHNLPETTVDVRIGNNMIERRRGYSYFRYERLLLKKFRREGFISTVEFIMLFATKLLLRILPTSLLKIVYRRFLRKSL